MTHGLQCTSGIRSVRATWSEKYILVKDKFIPLTGKENVHSTNYYNRLPKTLLVSMWHGFRHVYIVGRQHWYLKSYFNCINCNVTFLNKNSFLPLLMNIIKT